MSSKCPGVAPVAIAPDRPRVVGRSRAETGQRIARTERGRHGVPAIPVEVAELSSRLEPDVGRPRRDDLAATVEPRTPPGKRDSCPGRTVPVQEERTRPAPVAMEGLAYGPDVIRPARRDRGQHRALAYRD